MALKILVLSRYGTQAASTRQRFALYSSFLSQHGVELYLHPLLSNEQVSRIGGAGATPRMRVLGSYWRRFIKVVKPGEFDLLWIAYELFPYLPSCFEQLVRVSGIPYVVDYDDAIFHVYDEHRNPIVRKLLSGKMKPLLHSAAACTCGNAYLQGYAARFCHQSVIIPTVVDTNLYRPRAAESQEGRSLVVGWIGSPTTWKNVEPLLPAILAVLARHKAMFHVIGAGPAVSTAEGINAFQWSEGTEVPQLQLMDVGIMPLLDRPFQRGKCGYKLIQYMACGVPVVASPVGVNREIVERSGSGLLAESSEQWTSALERLLADSALRQELGSRGRKAAVERYSLAATAPKVLSVLRSAAEARPAGSPE